MRDLCDIGDGIPGRCERTRWIGWIYGMEEVMDGEGGNRDGGHVFKPGRVNGKNASYRSGSKVIPSRVRYELVEIMREHLTKGATKDKKVGSRTAELRKTVILSFFSDLFHLRYRIESVHNLRQKHLEAVFKFLEAEGQSPATLQNKISIMRIFCEWIGKPGMVTESSRYVVNPLSTKRTMVVQEDKSWDGHGVDIMEKIGEIREEDERSAGALLLCYAFGLRIREAVMMNVFKAHDGDVLAVVYGTKGGRARSIPIEYEWQMEILEDVKGMVDQTSGRLMRRGKTEEQERQRVYYRCRKHGITLADDGISVHGLRHQYMHERFEEQLGVPAPVKGGDISVLDRKKFREVTGRLMERAGHSRVSIGASYYGSRRYGKREGTPSSVTDKGDGKSTKGGEE